MTEYTSPLPEVSIIIACYNLAEYVAQAIESAISQTHPSVEVVIVDDGSTDNSPQVIASYADSYPERVRVISQANQGFAKTLDVGVREAKGRYVLPLGADDYFHPQAVEGMYRYAQAHLEYAVVYPDHCRIRATGEFGAISSVSEHALKVEGDILPSVLGGGIVVTSALILKEAIQRVGGYFLNGVWHSEYRHEDYFLYLRMLLLGYQFGHVSQPLLYYRDTPNSRGKDVEGVRLGKHTALQYAYRHYPHRMVDAANELLSLGLGHRRDALELRSQMEARLSTAREQMAQEIQAHHAAILQAEREKLIEEYESRLRALREQSIAEHEAILHAQLARAKADYEAALETQRQELRAEQESATLAHLEQWNAEQDAALQAQRERLQAESEKDVQAQRGVLQMKYETEIRLQRESSDSQLRAWQQRAQAAESSLATVFHTRSWKVITAWWNIRDRAKNRVTQSTWRGYHLTLTSWRVLREHGVSGFVGRVRRWLRGERRYFRANVLNERIPAVSANVVNSFESRYQAWIKTHEPDDVALTAQRQRSQQFTYQPLVSVVVPVYNPLPGVFQDMLRSVLEQTYSHFELCIANGGDSEACRGLLDYFAGQDRRINVVHLDTNQGISENTNAALALATGEFVALVDHDDVLAPFALFAIVEALNEHSDLDILYSDEDKLTRSGERVAPFMKPDWSPELLHSFMYVGHLSIYRKTLVDQLGGFRKAYDGSQDYDLILRASEATDRIHHIPQVLYHWRMVPTSAASDGRAKDYARRTNLAALGDAMERRGFAGRVVEYPFSNRFKFDLSHQPLVSIIIPTDSLENITQCLRSLYKQTGYSNLEVLVVTNSNLAAVLEAQHIHSSLSCIRYDRPFNFSEKNNLGARQANGEYLVFLNDDVKPLSRDWIETLLEYAHQTGIGGVSPKMLYEDETIQYAGMVTGVRDMVGTAFHRFPRHDGFYNYMADSIRNVSVLSGACVMVKASAFWQVGGWDAEHAPNANSDVDFSFRLREGGFRLVYTPFAEMRHIGHKSIGVLESERLDDLSNLYVLHRWGSALSYDPNYPDNMRDLIYHAADGSRIYAIDNSNLDHWDKQCNILFISHDFTLTGAPIILLNIVRYMRDAGCSVVVVSPQEGPLLEVYRHERIPAIIDPHILVNPFISRHTLAPYDLVVPNTVLGWHCVHAVKSLGKPCVWLIQESEFGLRHILNEVIHAQTAFWLADAVIFPAERAVAIYRGLRRANPHLAVHYGIADIGQDHPQPLFERKSGKVYFVHVGTVEHRKGPDTLIESIKRLSSDIAAQVEVLLVGRFLFPDYADQMRKMAHSFENIHFTGEIPWKDALATMAGGDVFVCTSREETGPLVVFEALALGKPVISTRVGAMEEILRDGENAYLIDVDDVEALTDRITDLVTHPEKREALGRAARQTYEEHLTIDRYGSELRAIFDKAIEGQPIEEHWVGAG